MIDDCEPVQGVSVNPSTISVNGVVDMTSEATMCAEVVAKPRYSLVSTDGVVDLKSFLARPNAYATGSISTGTGFINVTNFDTLANFTSIFGGESFNRMVGAVGFRATLVFRVVVTATPFHQGILCLNWQYGTTGTFGNSARRGHFPYLCANLPHVKLDVSEATEAVLRVPFVSHREYIPISSEIWTDTTSANYGTISLTKLTDFRLGGTQTAARYTLYASMEDVEVIGATPFATTPITLQAGMSVADREAVKGGIVSGTLDALSGVATQVARFPSLRTLGTGTAWFLRCASKAASAFGFSRPMDTRAVKKHYIPGYRFESHIDVPHTGIVTAPFQDNKLLVDGTVGLTDEDEMSFDYILSKPAMIYRGTITSSTAQGDFIYGAPVAPIAFWYREGSTTNGNITMPANASSLTINSFCPSHLLYIGNGFRYWRGSLKFTFMFSKTKMHGGRVLISYMTNPTLVNGNSLLSNQIAVPTTGGGVIPMEGYNKMFDLRDSSTVDFVVPYSSFEPFTSMLSKIGDISVQMVAPLNSVTSGADSIDFLVFVEALPGFQFAGACPATLESVGPGSNNTSGGVQLQAGGVETVDDQSQYVMGEKFMSAKQVMMLPARYTQVLPGSPAVQVMTLKPFFCRDRLPALSGTNPTTSSNRCAFFAAPTRMIDMYSFANGSTDYSFTRLGATTPVDLSFNTFGNDGNIAFTGTGAGNLYNKNNNISSGHTIVDGSGTVRIRVPAFSRFARIPIQPIAEFYDDSFTSIANSASNSQFLSHGVNAIAANGSLTERPISVSLAAGEDAYCAQYVGPPLCTLFQSSATERPNTTPTLNVIA